MASGRCPIAEKICHAAEIFFCKRFADLCPQEVAIKIPLVRLAWQPDVQELLKQTTFGDRCFPQGASEEHTPTLTTAAAMEMHEALRPSKILAIWFDGCQELVVHRPLAASFCQLVEGLLYQNRIAESLAIQGSMALRVVLGLPAIHAALQQRGFPCGNAALEMMRLVVSVSSRTYQIKGVGLDALLQAKGQTPYLGCHSDVGAPLPNFDTGLTLHACQSQVSTMLPTSSECFGANAGAFIGHSDVSYGSQSPGVGCQHGMTPMMPSGGTFFEPGSAVACPTPMQASSLLLGDQMSVYQDSEFDSFYPQKPPESSANLQADANSFMFIDSSITTEAPGEWRRSSKQSQSDPRKGKKELQQSKKPSQGTRKVDAEQSKVKPETSHESRGSSSSIGFRGRDVAELGKLLTFYFQPFNLQHIRMFCSIIQEQLGKECIDCPPPDWRPTFDMDDLLALPRLNKHLGKYSTAKAKLLVVRKALTENNAQDSDGSRLFEASPVELSESKSDIAKLVLTYEPKLRHIAGLGGRFLLNSKLQALLDYEIGSHTSVEPPPPNMFLALSYSVASELSSCDVRRGPQICKAIESGMLDSSYMNWEPRLQQLKRQLLYYRADIMCLQAIQGAGTLVCCSEDASHWSSFGDAKSSQLNHLKHLYEELGKANYGMVYAPTVQLPGKNGLSLGNAVFWNRSRWKLERHFELYDGGAVCVQLTSRVGGPCILACSAKPGESFSAEKGNDVTHEQLVLPLQTISQSLQEEADIAGAIPLLCGDFGCEPDVLQSALSASLTLPWQSACTEVLGREPWTSASGDSCGRTVDYVLHDHRLKALAVLDGRPGKADAVELLKAGFPSDHLLMLAALEVSDPTGSPQSGSVSKAGKMKWSDTFDEPGDDASSFLTCAAVPWAGSGGRTGARTSVTSEKAKSKRSSGGTSRRKSE